MSKNPQVKKEMFINSKSKNIKKLKIKRDDIRHRSVKSEDNSNALEPQALARSMAET